MAVEKRNPLPIGRYWIAAVNSEAMLVMEAWFTQNSRTVKVVKREANDAVFGTGLEPNATPWDPSTWEYGVIGSSKWNWYLFDVTEPTQRWRSGVKGLSPWPNVVKSATAPNAPQITTAADTFERPPPMTLSDSFNEFFGDAKAALVLIGLIYFASKSRKR